MSVVWPAKGHPRRVVGSSHDVGQFAHGRGPVASRRASPRTRIGRHDGRCRDRRAPEGFGVSAEASTSRTRFAFGSICRAWIARGNDGRRARCCWRCVVKERSDSTYGSPRQRPGCRAGAPLSLEQTEPRTGRAGPVRSRPDLSREERSGDASPAPISGGYKLVLSTTVHSR